MARLVLNPNSPGARQIELKPGKNLIGRGDQNDFQIEDNTVSTTHCEVVVADGSTHIKDLGSTNGTFVNRTPVLEANLENGETVHLGQLEMVYYAEPGTPPAATPVRVVLGTSSRTGSGGEKPSISPVALSPRSPIRLQGLPPSPAEPSHIPAPPPPLTTAEAAGVPATTVPSHCKHHPRTPGRFACYQCQLAFCDLCVTIRSAGSVQKRFCRHCGSECVPVLLRPTVTRAAQKGFFSRVPGAFVYPFRGSGLLVLIVATILFSALRWFTGGTSYGFVPRVIGWGMVLWVFATGYMFSYMQNIVQGTATEEEEMPPLPSMADFWGDILVPCLQFLGLTLMCFGPAFGVLIFAAATAQTSLVILVIALLVLGCIYFPMAFLAVAVLDSVMAANPLQVIPSILKVPGQYIITVFLLAFVFGLRSLGDFVMPFLFPKGLSTHSMGELAGFLAASAFWSVAGIYLLTVNMRILGLLYVTNKERLGWLAR